MEKAATLPDSKLFDSQCREVLCLADAALAKLNDLLGDDLCCEVGPIRQRNMRKGVVEGTVSQFDCGD